MEKGENGGMEQNMTQEKVMEILGKVDHTLLAVDATWE